MSKTTHATTTPETYHQPPLPHQHNHRAQTVVHYTPKTPCHPHFTEVDCTLSKHSGGFAPIDPRHAGDTPQGSAYGSNSPQATNEDNPHHQDKWTRMSNTTHTTRTNGQGCRTRPTPHQRHTTSHHTTSHHSKPKPPHGDATAQPRAGGTPRGYSKRGRREPTPCASALTHP